MQTTLGGGSWNQREGLYLDELAAWGKVAKKIGLGVVIKPHRGGGMSNPSEAVELIKELDKPSWLEICYDYSHYDFRDMPMGKTLQTALAHVAVKDVVMKNGIRFG